MLANVLSSHAKTRANQRGIYHEMMDAVLSHADHEIPVGDGCYALQLSRRQLRDPKLKARIGSCFDRLAGLVLVCCSGTGEIVTVMRDCGPAARRYRRQ